MNAAPDKTPKFTDTMRVMRIGVRGMYRSRLPQMSAALAFRTLFALIPMLVISVAAIGAFAEPDDVRNIFDKVLDSALIRDITGAGTEAQVEVETPIESDVDADGQAAPSADEEEDESARLDEILTELVDRLLNIPFGALGAMGILTLIYAAISMIIEIERAFNNIYRAQAGKGWGKRIAQYWAIITLVPILLFAAFYVSNRFRGMGEQASTAEFESFLGLAGPIVGSIVSVAITSLLLLLAYTIIPNTRVRIRTGVVGALVAATLWEFAKWGFRLYLDYSASYAAIYGSLAILPLFMLWIYLTWLIILFGLQVSYGLQHIELAKRIDEEDAEDRLTDPAAVLGVLAVIAGRFARGKTTTMGHLTDELSLPADVVDTMIGKLTRASILRDVDGGEDSYVLARPAEAIGLDDAFDAMNDITDAGRGSKSSWGGAIERLEQARQDIVRGQSVADLINVSDEHQEAE
ncbi:MAG: hypothetical protein COB69_10150 [Phycisphaera sp.]|nr:MAG: hypothetical protein COB69_10150 [Phycisphaera sp.]